MYDHQALKLRTKQFAVSLIRMVRGLPTTDEAKLIGRQLIRAGTSVAANYRATGRSRSRAEFVAKIGVVVEETDETVFWIEMLTDSDILPAANTREALKEANELLAIFAASQRTVRRS